METERPDLRNAGTQETVAAAVSAADPAPFGKLRERSRAFIVKQRERSGAFTLLELLVVVGIVSLLLVAVIPAVTSLSKSSGGKAAVSNLMNALEQARSLAF